MNNNKDTITKTYMKDNAVFADAFNYYVYSGRQVIKPNDLRELDTAESVIIFVDDDSDGSQPKKTHTNEANSSGKNSNGGRADTALHRYRDVLKSAVFKRHGDIIYAILGIENQSNIHYAMPVRSFVYDALQYAKQVDNTAARHKANRTHLRHNEYLSGFRKEDKLTPVITLVLYFGVDKWDGAKSIHEMLNTRDPRLLKYVQDYRINLIEPAGIEPEELDKFSTSLREVLGYIKYANDKDKLVSFITANPDTVINANAARVINAMTKTYIDIPDDAKEVNMCKAIEDLINDSKAEGMAEGMAEGISQGRLEGRNEGIAEGMSKGRHDGYLDAMIGLVRDNLLSIRDAAARVNMTEEAFTAMLRK